MRSRTGFIALVVGAALVLGACGDPGVVATVGSRTIDRNDVLEIRDSYADAATVTSENFRQDLTNLIISEAMLEVAEEDFGLDGLDDPAAIDAFIADPGDDLALIEGIRNAPDFTEAAQRHQAQLLLLRREVSKALVASDTAFLEETFASQPELINRVCARHILVGTLEEAQQVLEDLESGVEFARLAADVSLDTQSPGGELPCPTPASGYVDGFSTAVTLAPIGELFGPVQTEFGWHVIQVTERTAPASLEEFLADPVAFLDPVVARDRFNLWLDDAVARVDIEVDPAVGTWFPAADGIVPPPA